VGVRQIRPARAVSSDAGHCFQNREIEPTELSGFATASISAIMP
jgi:hypothetical protein